MPWWPILNWHKHFTAVDNMKRVGKHQGYKGFSEDNTERTTGFGA